MALGELPLEEREERARLIDYMLESNPSLHLPSCSNVEYLLASEDKMEATMGVVKAPCRLIIFFKAANLVRKNYEEWKKFLKDPTQLPPQVFQGYFENKLLVLFLFFFDSIKYFNLDPRYPFFVCVNVSTTDSMMLHENNIDSEIFRSLEIGESLVNMWNSFGCPEKETTDVGFSMTMLTETLKNSNRLVMNRGRFNLRTVLGVFIRSLDLSLIFL